PAFLFTLKEIDYFSGIGEIVKLHIIGGKNDIRNYLLIKDGLIKKDYSSIFKTILRSIEIKKLIIEEDEFDKGKRNILNYGHCFGHALEYATNFKIPHGQAVILGIILANYVSVKRLVLSERKA